MVLVGDGTEGAPEFAPFDAIVVSAAYPRLPSRAIAAGRPVQGGETPGPAGRPGGAEHVALYQKEQHGLRLMRFVMAASFVQLPGRHGFPLPEP